jgi:hypothetical protein
LRIAATQLSSASISALRTDGSGIAARAAAAWSWPGSHFEHFGDGSGGPAAGDQHFAGACEKHLSNIDEFLVERFGGAEYSGGFVDNYLVGGSR